MMKSFKLLFFPIVIFALVLSGCNDLFDKGDVEKSYDGPDQIAFGSLENTVQVEIEEDGSHSSYNIPIDIQLISSEGLASSDYNVSFSVNAEATNADESLYNLSATSVTISSGSAFSTFTITIPAEADIEIGEEYQLTLDIDNANGVQIAPNLDQTVVYIQGVEPSEE